MSETLFYCPDGTVINARQIGSMRRVGFTVIGVTPIGERVIANFDSEYEAKEYLKHISEKVPKIFREKAFQMATAAIVEFLVSRFKPFAFHDSLLPVTLTEVEEAVCIGRFSSSLALEVLGKLRRDGNILDYGDKYCLPDRPTRTAVKLMTNRLFEQYYKNSAWLRPAMIDYITRSTNNIYDKPERLGYPSEWAETLIDTLIQLGLLSDNGESKNDPGVKVVGVVEHPETLDNDLYSTVTIEMALDEKKWKALPEMPTEPAIKVD